MKKTLPILLIGAFALTFSACALTDRIGKKADETQTKLEQTKEAADKAKQAAEEAQKKIEEAKQYKDQTEKDLAISKAISVYEMKKAAGVNFSQGPCLAEDIMPGWVADIAHNPRTAVDDKPENQCESFRTGKASHFVELDPNGVLIKAY